MKSTFLSYIYPQTIARFSSRYNKDIRVVEEHGQPKILVNGSPQSGPYIKKLWRKTFRAFGVDSRLKIETVLILGVAGGTVINLVNRLYPTARITAVDIDPLMIKLGKNFFALGEIGNLKLLVSDARDFVNKSVDKKYQYDLIIVDLSFGRHFPDFLGDVDFLSNLKKIKIAKGSVVINYLREREYREKSQILLGRLHNIYPYVSEKSLFLNRFFLVR